MKMKKLYLTVRCAAFAAMLFGSAAVSGQSEYLTAAPGYGCADLLPDENLFSAFAVDDSRLAGIDSDGVRLFDLATQAPTAEFPLPGGDSYFGFPGFLEFDPAGDALWVGFTVSGNSDDRIYKLDLQSGAYTQVATMGGNMDIDFHPVAGVLVAGLNSASWDAPNSVFRLDVATGTLKKVIELGGMSTGFAVEEATGDVVAGTTEGGIYRWSSASVEQAAADPSAPHLTLEQGEKLTDLPSGTMLSDIAAAGGRVYFNHNGNGGTLCVWDGTPAAGANFEVMATAVDESDWLTNLKATADALYTLAYACPVAKVWPEPPVLAQPVATLFALAGSADAVIDLDDHFAAPADGVALSYSAEVFAVGDPCAEVSLDGSLLTVRFLAGGQQNVTVTASANGAAAAHTFVVGVAQPAPEGAVAHFDDLTLAPGSFWNGDDMSGQIATGGAIFANQYTPEWGSWSGFAYSNMADTATPGYENQYSAIAGADFSAAAGLQGANYGVGYDFGNMTMRFADARPHVVEGLYVTNATYAALAMRHGDAIAKKFGGETGHDPDWFRLTITGMRDGAPTGAVDFYLADYRSDDDRADYIVQTWQWVSTATLGAVDSLAFALASSDTGEWGANTPTYFCVDNVVYGNAEVGVDIAAAEPSFAAFPNPTSGLLAVEAPGHLRVVVSDVSGRRISAAEGRGRVDFDLSAQPAGVYFITVDDGRAVSTEKIVKK